MGKQRSSARASARRPAQQQRHHTADGCLGAAAGPSPASLVTAMSSAFNGGIPALRAAVPHGSNNARFTPTAECSVVMAKITQGMFNSGFAANWPAVGTAANALFINAVRRGDIKDVEILLDHCDKMLAPPFAVKIDINAPKPCHITTTMELQFPEITLSWKESDETMMECSRMTALALAVQEGDEAMMEFLIKRGAEVDRPSPHLAMTPLSIAALYGDVKATTLLLEHGATPLLCTDLHRASPRSFLWETLGFQPASISIGASWSALHYACGTQIRARSGNIVFAGVELDGHEQCVLALLYKAAQDIMDGDISAYTNDDEKLDELVCAFTQHAAEAVQLALDGGPELAERAIYAEGAVESRCDTLIRWAATNGFELLDDDDGSGEPDESGDFDEDNACDMAIGEALKAVKDEELKQVCCDAEEEAVVAAKKSAANRKKKEQKRRSRQRKAAAVTVIQAAIRGWACRRRLSRNGLLIEEPRRRPAETEGASSSPRAEAEQERGGPPFHAAKRTREEADRAVECELKRCSSAPKQQRAEQEQEQETPAQAPTSLSSCPSGAARPPAQFCCPLTLELMRDPVSLASGQTYERVEVTRWLTEARRKGQKPRDPLTNSVLESKAIVPNIALRQLIEMWQGTHGSSCA